MKALEKDLNRRYESASAFADDVQRYLDDEPVQAGPPSAVYRFKKYARRNKRAFGTTGLVVAALLVLVLGGLSAGAIWLWHRADTARDLAETALQREQTAKASEAKARRQLAVLPYLRAVGLAHNAWVGNDVIRARQLLDASEVTPLG